jgi:hypothetical protein
MFNITLYNVQNSHKTEKQKNNTLSEQLQNLIEK